MTNPTRVGQVQHLLRLLDACPTACRVVFHNPALPSGVIIHIPPVGTASHTESFTVPSQLAEGGPPDGQ
jgi:hypothetical protein